MSNRSNRYRGRSRKRKVNNEEPFLVYLKSRGITELTPEDAELDQELMKDFLEWSKAEKTKRTLKQGISKARTVKIKDYLDNYKNELADEYEKVTEQFLTTKHIKLLGRIFDPISRTHFEDIPFTAQNYQAFLCQLYEGKGQINLVKQGCKNIIKSQCKHIVSKVPELTAACELGPEEEKQIYKVLATKITGGHADLDVLYMVADRFDAKRIEELLNQNPKLAKVFEEIEQERRRERALKQFIINEIPDSYADLYPLARMMKRHFILHLGPTNSGKTYQALQRFRRVPRGIYLAPLRLLAYEVFERTNAEGVPCNMITGEEEIRIDGAMHQASTVEIMNPDEYYHVAVIDECQMIADKDRGGAWTAAILGVQAQEVHLCAPAYAKDLLVDLIMYCGDSYEIQIHERATPLKMDAGHFVFPTSVRNHDALIVFSKKNVLAVAAELQREGIKASVVYGALPYEVRQQEMAKFVSGETKVVVATDAIGMGLNLPAKRVVFLETEKYDGITRRLLQPEEVKQIAGRAGRKGIFDVGFVAAEYKKKYVEKCMMKESKPLTKARLSFQEQLIHIEGHLSEIMEKWNSIPDTGFFEKGDISEKIKLCKNLEQYSDNKKMIMRFLDIPFNERDKNLVALWEQMFLAELRGENLMMSLEAPEIPGEDPENLQALEDLYSACDLVYGYCRMRGDHEGMDKVMDYRKLICTRIISLLAKQELPGKTCRRCQKELRWNYPYQICDDCYFEEWL